MRLNLFKNCSHINCLESSIFSSDFLWYDFESFFFCCIETTFWTFQRRKCLNGFNLPCIIVSNRNNVRFCSSSLSLFYVPSTPQYLCLRDIWKDCLDSGQLSAGAECVGGFQAARVFDNGIKYRIQTQTGISHRWVTASSVLVLVTQCTLQSGGQSVLPEVTALSPFYWEFSIVFSQNAAVSSLVRVKTLIPKHY